MCQANASCNQVVGHPRESYSTKQVDSHMQGVISFCWGKIRTMCCKWYRPLPTKPIAQAKPSHMCLSTWLGVPHTAVGPLAPSIKPFCVVTKAQKNCWLWGQLQKKGKGVRLMAQEKDGDGAREGCQTDNPRQHPPVPEGVPRCSARWCEWKELPMTMANTVALLMAWMASPAKAGRRLLNRL